MSDKPHRYRIEDCDSLTIAEVWEQYRRYVNPVQVDLLSAFAFGRDRVVSAEGMWLTTGSGRRILDFSGGIGVLNHGHNHPRILDVRRRFQDDKRMEVHKYFFSPYLAALSANLASVLPGDLDIVYLPNSGAEAVEGALKMAFKVHEGKRRTVLHSDISYHGTLMGAASVSASKELWYPFPEIPGAATFEYGNLQSVKDAVEQHRDSGVYALIVEPVSASSLEACGPVFLTELRALCDAEGIVLIFDEVFTGLGKCGALFSFMAVPDLVPDILVASKSIGGGKASISAYVARTPIFKRAYGSSADMTLHTTTYNGFGEEAATALEALNIAMDDDYPARARHIGARLVAGLQTLQDSFSEHIAEIKGQGALMGMRLHAGPEMLSDLTRYLPGRMASDGLLLKKIVTASVLHDLYDRHDVLTYFRENRDVLLMAAPALIAEDAEIDRFLEALRSSLSEGLPALIARFVKSKVMARFLVDA